MTALVSVVVVNWNGRAALERGLPSIVGSLANVHGAELVVVDNGSVDGSAEVLERLAPAARLIRNDDNVGFSPAANQGIRATEGTYVALLNNDVVCHPDWLRLLVDALEADPRLGTAAAQLRYLHDPGRINSAGIIVDLIGRARDRRDGLPASAEPQRPVAVFGGSGGAVLYRRAMLDEVGLLDERYFAYLEDVDLAWRARRRGWGAVYVPGSIVLHEFSASSAQVQGLKNRLSNRNLVWTLVKNASATQLAVAIPAHVILLVWTVALAIRARDSSALRGLWEGVRGAPAIARERTSPMLPLRAFAVPLPLRYRVAGRLRRSEARQTVEPEIRALAGGG